ncbi:glycine--tRNA ligase subunit beta [Motiliproteus sp. MSK22-1]|uniref:glycine--tRNA ligase subunit beta n=1 Tax=Motiliproteus sp. MSK22-1 TaxID=1897630 RepID=UPI0009778E34|nr:glycine--tRNA ligase subunit beta [Motiliproteus sp. MSK22-1]OMH39456.1 glycine--tRNA ligase subunit beta [Motiliproteus sp. MSK22-1]
MEFRDFLFELGTEELPPKALKSLSNAFMQSFETGLADIFAKDAKQILTETEIHAFATPRRLAIRATALPTHTPSKTTVLTGPPVQICFDADKKPTKALEGFAKKCGASIDELEEQNGKMAFSQQEPAQPINEKLAALIQQCLDSLPIPKRMRWGTSKVEFVRPAHWCVMLFGDEVLDAEILGHQAARKTFGHRFHYNKSIELIAPSEYESALAESGYVIADFDKRRRNIEEQIHLAAESLGAKAVIDPALLDEVTGLVEWPVALSGRFEERFLEVPAEALVSSMKEHQKYFHVVNEEGAIQPYFITISNIESKDPQQVISGNERVIRPRLADAAFFFETDKKHSLESRIDRLKPIVFQAKLGTVYDKSVRVSKLASVIAGKINGNTAWAERAAMLAKTDLVSEMVLEFTDLQGLMGYHYATNDGEPEEVAAAIYQQYLPKFAGDTLPDSKTGQAIAIADRLDTLVGLFGINQPPTGSKDPFALRRATLGTLRILVEKELDLDLLELLEQAANNYADLPARDGLEKTVLEFMLERFRAWYSDEGVPAEIFLAVKAKNPTSPLDFDNRVKAVNHFRTLPQAEALAAANKRVSNILAKQGDPGSVAVDTTLMQEDAERALHTELSSLDSLLGELMAEANYKAVLENLAQLQASVDHFFDKVMVMADDEKVRDNRIRLLSQLRSRFLLVADIALLG